MTKSDRRVLKAVYLDTNVFFTCQFNFRDKRLKKLGELAFAHGIELWSSDIAYTELQVAIRERIGEIDTAIGRAKNILTHCVGEIPFDDAFSSSAIKRALQTAEDFFRDEYVRLLSVYDLDETDISKVFSDYFNRRGCFASERKRSEFPDAFQISMLLRNVRNFESVAVVSQDPDFTHGLDSVSQIKVFPSIEQLISELERLPRPPDTSEKSPVLPPTDRSPITDFQDEVLGRILCDHESVDMLATEITHDAERLVSDHEVWEALSELVRRAFAMPYRYSATTKGYEVSRMPLVIEPDVWFYRTTVGREEYERRHS